jgi:hypothetical protein
MFFVGDGRLVIAVDQWVFRETIALSLSPPIGYNDDAAGKRCRGEVLQ